MWIFLFKPHFFCYLKIIILKLLKLHALLSSNVAQLISYCSNPGNPFAAGVRLEKLSAMTVDDTGKETFITGGALDCIQKVLL